ncbi:NAD(+) synthase [Cereibacter sphaeroides]|uniref:NAD(+) synthase n=1 Tax=Cereibacter sphaeroides TaxID=1063 RepID=UPI000F531370|nr:NAD(+) synthase [Cereibacter sphaeroides]AZB56357.1 NAD(+) synthase [Cereibacter sphaeroides]AZB60615.1 NAD(+) synthase [Cereibacter sphaeroides]
MSGQVAAARQETLVEEILDLSRQRQAGPLSPWFAARLEEQVEKGLFLSPEDLEATGARLVEELVEYRTRTQVSTAVIGMSGGVDSALTAALFKAAGWHVVGHTLPIEQDPTETDRGIEACAALGIEHRPLDLSGAYEAALAQLGELDPDLLSSDETPARTRRGNLRARLRMMTLYDQAHRLGGLVAGTDNFSELTAGFWTLHGDVGDLAPVQSLLKSWEVPWLARAYGVPEATWRAMPTDGLGIGGGDEAQIGATYLEWDILQFALAEALGDDPGLATRHLAFALRMDADRHAQEVLGTLIARMRATWQKRLNPIRLNHPKADRYEPLERMEARLFRPQGVKSDEALMGFPAEMQDLAAHLVRALKAADCRLVTAESCTAGLIAACVSGVPGRSGVLEGSFVAYRPTMKFAALGVPEALIAEETVYDPKVARRMAEGALASAPEADLALAVTGVAGPGEDEGHPPGYVCVAAALRGQETRVSEHYFPGSPRQVLAATLRRALQEGLTVLQEAHR